MAKGHRHPTHGERRQIHVLKESRLSIPAIARRPSGISTQRQGPLRRRNRSLPGSACRLPRLFGGFALAIGASTIDTCGPHEQSLTAIAPMFSRSVGKLAMRSRVFPRIGDFVRQRRTV